MFTGDGKTARRHASATRTQQQLVTRQRLQHAQQAGFKPIDKPVDTTTKTAGPTRRKSTGGGVGPVRQRGSESSNNPLSGDEYY